MSEAQTQVMSEAQKKVMSEAQKKVMSEAQILILQGSATEDEIAAITVACLQINARPKSKSSTTTCNVSNWKRTAAYESIRSEALFKSVQTGNLWQN